ncbi:asparagine synthase (glutamine-hydrolyzing) [Saccharothrix syringae]|uniref:asparagine synthase (glutamine-hydrolyzing) n=1 Tax=Saccharothrix syringae TaxID=103733 RepID=A0A5Q0GXZ2_SACSY|nr:asparagine synthase (glutamine-hydrolyzing) [Saccharothrix syringae]QFZ18936.1 asparagine synthase (glutamine-hydrolyzing) [Saccharothrix syringae]
MCGVAGWVSFDRDLTDERPTIEAMTHVMRQRGPDEWGIWTGTHAALGHRRLSIIDLPGGTQPMAVDTPDGQVVLSYSGETYNFVELRDELRRRGHRFRTSSDTEVVLRGYLEWGVAVAERMVGMCAIGLWDGRDERMVLIRDRLGTKPLHYFPTEDGIVFGSEPKAILAHPLVEPVVDTDGIRRLLLGFPTYDEGVWSGVKIVQPGTVITVDRSGLRQHTYWRLTAAPHEDDEETTVHKVREMLEDNVAHELVADVPRGVLLSGGLDSSVLTGLADRTLRPRGEVVRTFSVDFPNQAENFTADSIRLSADGPYIADVVAHVGTDHRHLVLDHRALSDPEVRREVVAAWDAPYGMGDMNSSLFLLFKALKEHVTVALSGEAGDEIFMGHLWHHAEAVRTGDDFPWFVAWPQLNTAAYMSREFIDLIDLPAFSRDSYHLALTEVPHLDGEDDRRRRQREIAYLGLTRFMRTLEDRLDRIAMRAGVETRVPFCDYRLVEYLYNVPWSMHTSDGHEKSLLRAAARDVVPESVAARRKSGYPSTQDLRYVAALQEQVRDVLAAPNGDALFMCDPAKVARAVAADPAEVDPAARFTFERILDVDAWLDIAKPTLKLT